MTHTYLVTGCAGFIGSHLSEALIARGDVVWGIDNFDPTYPKEIKVQSIKYLQGQGNFHFYEGDIRSPSNLQEIFSAAPFDAIFHLAARAGVRESFEDPLTYEEINIRGTLQTLNAVARSKIQNFIFASSSSVYGANTKTPFSETDLTQTPLSPYAATKLTGEQLCHVFSNKYHFNAACLRIFTAYGPRQRPTLAIHKFTQLLSENKPLPIFGTDTSKRDYTYIGDLVQGILQCADWLSKQKGRYEILNMGSGHPITLREVIEWLEKKMGKKAMRDLQPAAPGDVPMTFANISRASTFFGFAPQHSFTDGMEAFYHWFKEKGKSL